MVAGRLTNANQRAVVKQTDSEKTLHLSGPANTGEAESIRDEKKPTSKRL